MNIILFHSHEIDVPLPIEDVRAQHIVSVLRRDIGDSVDVGLINGPKGKAVFMERDERGLRLEFVWGEAEPPLYPIDLVVGLSRPQTNRKILQEATSLGVRTMRFVITDRGESSYASSKLWTTGEWERHVLKGVEQAFSTRVPEVSFGMSLEDALETVSGVDKRVCLDNYEATRPLLDVVRGVESVVLAVGSERGWTARERECFRGCGYELAHLGERPLRSETATIAALAVTCAAFGF